MLLNLLPGFYSITFAADEGDNADIFAAAESFFNNMRKSDYPSIWSGLTVESRARIVRNVHKEMRKAGIGEYTDERIRNDFETNGEISNAYWRGYLVQFDPKTILEESRWTMGQVKKDRAEIIIRYRKSQHDAILKMYLQEGLWKVGLEETFYTRRSWW